MDLLDPIVNWGAALLSFIVKEVHFIFTTFIEPYSSSKIYLKFCILHKSILLIPNNQFLSECPCPFIHRVHSSTKDNSICFSVP